MEVVNQNSFIVLAYSGEATGSANMQLQKRPGCLRVGLISACIGTAIQPQRRAFCLEKAPALWSNVRMFLVTKMHYFSNLAGLPVWCVNLADMMLKL